MHKHKRTKKKLEDTTQYDPKRHTKTKGGHGFGMKKGAKPLKYEDSGVHLAYVFGWEVPKELQHIKDVIDKQRCQA